MLLDARASSAASTCVLSGADRALVWCRTAMRLRNTQWQPSTGPVLRGAARPINTCSAAELSIQQTWPWELHQVTVRSQQHPRGTRRHTRIRHGASLPSVHNRYHATRVGRALLNRGTAEVFLWLQAQAQCRLSRQLSFVRYRFWSSGRSQSRSVSVSLSCYHQLRCLPWELLSTLPSSPRRLPAS